MIASIIQAPLIMKIEERLGTLLLHAWCCMIHSAVAVDSDASRTLRCFMEFTPLDNFLRSNAITPKDFRNASIGYKKQSCSFKRLKATTDNTARVEVDCVGTNTVTMRATLNFQLEELTISCSALFPLDAHMDIKPAFSVKSSFNRDSNHTFIVGIKTRSAHYFVPMYIPMDGNYTFYAVNNPGLSITFHLQLTPHQRPLNSFGLNIFIRNEMIQCTWTTWIKRDWFPHPVYIFLSVASGKNPIDTKWLRLCLQTNHPYCATNRRAVANSTKYETIPQHGVAYCRYMGLDAFLDFFTPIRRAGVEGNMSRIWEAENVLNLQQDDGKEDFEIEYSGGSEAVEEVREPPMFYESAEAAFECHFLDYFLHPPICLVKYTDGREEEVFDLDRQGKRTALLTQTEDKVVKVGDKRTLIKAVKPRFRAKIGMIAIQCRAAYWNYERYATRTLPIKILRLSEAIAPEFEVNEMDHSLTFSSLLQLNCSADIGTPEPTYAWEFVPKGRKAHALASGEQDNSAAQFYNISRVVDHGRSTSILTVPVLTEGMDGVYTCHAENVRGSASRRFVVNFEEQPDRINEQANTWFYLGICLSLVLLLTLVVIVLGRSFYSQRGRLSAMEIMLFEKGDAKELQEDGFAHENALFMPYNRDYEIHWKDFKIFEEEKLGEGEFGVVFKGCLAAMASRTVAIKAVKAGAEKPVIMALLSELKVMIHLGSHESVVKLIGACTSFLKEGRLYVLLEYCPLGSLKSFLGKTNKESFVQTQIHDDSPSNAQEEDFDYDCVDKLSTSDLVGWAIQISRGMQHLQDKKVIHGDLAARNILLMSKSEVKITDFGLSSLSNYDTYVKKSQAKLPWRWMAVETLKNFEFSHASDVWAYGVTLWEIFTLGLVPYPGMAWTSEFVSLLEQNLRLHQPQFAAEKIYKIMVQCWKLEPKERPDFQLLEQQLLGLAS